MTEARERLVAWSLFALLIIGGFRFPLSWLRHRPGPPNGLDRRPLPERDDPSPPQFRAFLETARAQTAPGATVSIDFAAPYDGFSYAYWRARHFPPPPPPPPPRPAQRKTLFSPPPPPPPSGPIPAPPRPHL